MTEHRKTDGTANSGIRQFGTILKFELKGCLTNKANIIFTVILILIIAAVTFFPRVRQMFTSDSKTSESSGVAAEGTPGTDSNAPVMLVGGEAAVEDSMIPESFASAFAGYQVVLTEQSTDEIRRQILAEEAECAFILDSLTSYKYYVKDFAMQDTNTVIADELLQNVCTVSAMMRAGMTAQEASSALSYQIEHDIVNLGKDQVQNFFYTYIMIFALYMVILLYGQMIATNVATEKSSRAMELLITSAKPVSMMFGKVLASCLAGLTQLVAVFGSGLLFFRMNQEYWVDNRLISSVFDMPVWLFVYMLIFFVLGFLIYAFLYGAIGSTVSKLEDINSAVMPVTMLFIAAFVITMMSLADGSVDSLMMKVCSYVPFTSPMAMFTRLAMSTVSFYEIAVSIAILILSAVAVGVISAKIYRVGVLLYGTKMKIGTILKAIKKA
ncbi:hypothetical protein C823_003079 [Eubacterium plexicaudatum ASF492]|uniref:ABC-2 type transporter transmembrane domain-containing protein n=1 Tax=Eubacterium plexicaudatum ASF492 TaxID=1235802 RepID=N2AMD3_9FIRM|nr:hypothetical protein C823_003079 [Eubacterium plexicaudatum ASF492]